MKNRNLEQIVPCFMKLIQPLKFDEEDMAASEKVLRMLWNEAMSIQLPTINHNLLIFCENRYVAKYVYDKWIMALRLCGLNAALKSVYIDSEEDLAALKRLLENNELSVKQALIVLTRKDAFEDPRNIFGDELYFRGLPIHLNANTSEIQVITENIVNKLRSISSVNLNAEFEEAFTAYIETVYPKADLRRDNMAGDDQPFIDDAIQRVLREYTGRHLLGEEAGAECVPFYIKNVGESATNEEARNEREEETEEKAQKEPERQTAAEEVSQEAEKVIEPQKIETIADISDAELPETDIENILLLTMSRINSGNVLKWNDNKYEDSEAYVGGYFTMEPVPKLLIEQGKAPLLIIIMASDESREPVEFSTEKEGIPAKKYDACAVDFFKEQISEYAKDSGSRIYYKVVHTGNSKESPDIMMKNLEKAAGEVVETIRAKKDASLYLDMHGGKREDQLIVDAIVNMLNMDNIVIEDAFSIAGPGLPVISVKAYLGIFDFVSGMNEFINYGRAGTLAQFFESSQFVNNEMNKNFVRDVIGLAEEIQTCDINGVKSGLQRISNDIKNIEDNENSDNLLKIFAGTIRKDYGNLLANSVSDLALLKWCKRKEFYQQALTIIESRVPTLLMQHCMSYTIAVTGNARTRNERTSNERTIYERNSHEDSIKSFLEQTCKKRDWVLPANYVVEQLCFHNILENESSDDPGIIYCSLAPNDLANLAPHWKAEVESGKELEFRFTKRVGDSVRDLAKFRLSVSEGIDLDELNKFLQLHMSLKNQRNIANHASIETNSGRSSATVIYSSIDTYIGWLDSLLESVNCAG